MFKNKKEEKKEFNVVINDKNYNFFHSIIKIDFLNQKELILYKKIFLKCVDDKASNEEHLKILISYLRKNKQEFKDIHIATVKQHFVKKEIQENWENYVFFAEDKKNNEKVFLSSKEKNTINKKKSFVTSSTFDIFENNCFFYLEDGIVTILERYFEKMMKKNKDDIFSIEEQMINEYFFIPHLNNRIKRYKDFISFIEDDKNINDIIKKNFKNNKSFILEFDFDVFCLSFNWVEEFLLGEIYEDIAWNNISIMPFSPKKALIISDEDVISKIEKYNLNAFDFLINSFINFLRLKNNEKKNGSFNLSEFLLHNNGLLFCNDESFLHQLKEMSLEDKYKDFKNLYETEHFFIELWRNVNAENIKDNYNNVNDICKKQSKNITKLLIINHYEKSIKNGHYSATLDIVRNINADFDSEDFDDNIYGSEMFADHQHFYIGSKGFYLIEQENGKFKEVESNVKNSFKVNIFLQFEYEGIKNFDFSRKIYDKPVVEYDFDIKGCKYPPVTNYIIKEANDSIVKKSSDSNQCIREIKYEDIDFLKK